jgi:hypothetical protein
MVVKARHIDGVEPSAVALGESWCSGTRTTTSIRETALVLTALLWQCWIRRPSLRPAASGSPERE